MTATRSKKKVIANRNRNKRLDVNEWVCVEGSAIHGMGGFARVDIPKGTRVIEYVGEKITKKEAAVRCEAGNPYIFTLDDETDLDGDVNWNPARFINHTCDPNCETELDDGQIYLEAVRDIGAGEELSFDYCYDMEDWKAYPCHCKASKCRGYIISEELYSAAVAKEAAIA